MHTYIHTYIHTYVHTYILECKAGNILVDVDDPRQIVESPIASCRQLMP